MFKVECPSCDAPYQVDERRVPVSGLKMRCPKCGHSFVVSPPGDGVAPAAQADQQDESHLSSAGARSKATAPGIGAQSPQSPVSPAGPRVAPPPARAPAAKPPPPPGRSAGKPPPPLRPPPARVQPEAGKRSKQEVASDDDDVGLPAALGGPPTRGASGLLRDGGQGKPRLEDPLPVAGAPLPQIGAATRRGATIGGPGAGAKAETELSDPAFSALPASGQSDEADIDLPTLGDRIHGRPVGGSEPVPSRSLTPRGSGLSLARDSSGLDLDLDVELELPCVGRSSKPAGMPMTQRSADPVPVRQAPEDAPAAREPDPEIETGLPLILGDPAKLGGPRHEGRAPLVPKTVPLPLIPSLPAAEGPRSSGDTPSLDDSFELNLLSLGGEPDLPSPRADVRGPGRGLAHDDLPSPFEGDLPARVDDDLPALVEDNLPSRSEVQLPVRSEGGLPEPLAALPVPSKTAASVAMPVGAPSNRAPVQGGEFDLSSFQTGPVPDYGGEPLDGFGAGASEGGSEGGASYPSAAESSRDGAQLVRETGGGTSFGEVNLSGGDADIPLAAGAPGEPLDEMEFGGIPQAPESAAGRAAGVALPLQVPSSAPESARDTAAGGAPAQGRRRAFWIGIVAGTLALGGAALVLLPSVGPYGAYFFLDQFKRGEYERVLAAQVADARRHLAQDTRASADVARRNVERTLREYHRVRPLAAYAAFVGEFTELRFREEPAVKSRADVLLEELSGVDDVKYHHLASATRAAAEGKLALARQLLSRVTAADAKLADAPVVRAELELYAGEPKTALSYWMQADARAKSALTAFGLARTHFAAGSMPEARQYARLTLERNARHVGARILLARVLWTVDRSDAEALAILDQALKQRQDASALEIVEAYTLIGDIHLELSRISLAETAYAEALKVKPQAARALAGLGDTLYRAGRHSEALARFEAAIQADPDELSAAVGAAKTKIALEKNRDAVEMLKKLRQAHPRSALVHYWFGRAEETLGNRESAEKAYRAALESQARGNELVDAYVALALLMNQQGRSDEAQKVLGLAKSKLKNSPQIYQALGQLALVQGRYEEALANLRTALELNPEDLSSKFSLGVALRRNRQLDAAAEVFDEVSKLDRDYPGLALERGLLFEAYGRSEEALKAYESALARAPDDPDLMLRVGCSKVAAGHADQAVQLLRKVLGQRPNSAETNHCMGRALLLEGSNLALALRTLKRAVELDPNRAEYHLYVGWAANEAGRVVEAEEALQLALSLDQSLGDAYWQRGILRYRQGAIKDAAADLVRALDLKPGRHEAHAALADALHDLGDERGALEQWRLAVESQPDNATWHYRYGRVLQQNQLSNEARVELSRALELAEKMDPPPRWNWEAHRLLARAIGRQTESIKHWQAFLRLSPPDNVYREEAKSELAKLGQPWDGD